MKKRVCVMAFDDAPHNREDLEKYLINNNTTLTDEEKPKKKDVDLIGVVFRGLQLLHVSQSKISVDGTDSTEKILQQAITNPYLNEIRLVMIDSPTLAGFNVVNSRRLWEELKIPIVLMPEEKPKEKMVNVYSKIFPERVEQIQWLQEMPDLQHLEISINKTPEIVKKIYFHPVGIEPSAIKELLHHLTAVSSVPEPLRVAHLIASRTKDANNNEF